MVPLWYLLNLWYFSYVIEQFLSISTKVCLQDTAVHVFLF